GTWWAACRRTVASRRTVRRLGNDDADVVDRALDQARGAVVGHLDPDPDAGAAELVQAEVRRLPATGPVRGRAGHVVQLNGGAATDDRHPEVVGTGGGVEVGERPLVHQVDVAAGRDRDQRRGDDRRAIVDVVAPRVGTGRRTSDGDQDAVRHGAQLQRNDVGAGGLRHPPLEYARGGVNRQDPADRGLERVRVD